MLAPALGAIWSCLLWSLSPDWFSQADNYRNTAAGFGARVGLDVCDSSTHHCTGSPFESGLFLAFLFFFPACTMKHPFPLPNRISARWVASTRTHEKWKKTGTLLLRLFLKKTLEKEADFYYEGVLSPCSVFCHHVTRFLKGAESVGHWCINLQGAASFSRIPYLTELVSHGSVSPLFSHPLPASANSPLKMCFVTEDSPKELTLPVLLRNKNLCCS